MFGSEKTICTLSSKISNSNGFLCKIEEEGELFTLTFHAAVSCTYVSIALQPELLFALKTPVVESRVLAGSRTKRTISYEYNIPRNPDSEDIVSCTGYNEGICYLHHGSSLTPRVVADSAERSAHYKLYRIKGVMGRNGHMPEMPIRNMMMRSSAIHVNPQCTMGATVRIPRYCPPSAIVRNPHCGRHRAVRFVPT